MDLSVVEVVVVVVVLVAVVGVILVALCTGRRLCVILLVGGRVGRVLAVVGVEVVVVGRTVKQDKFIYSFFQSVDMLLMRKTNKKKNKFC